MDNPPSHSNIEPDLDRKYNEILSRAQRLPHFHSIVSTIVWIQSPISIDAIAAFLGLPSDDVNRVLVALRSILQPGQIDVPAPLLGTPLHDFLTNRARAGDYHSPPSHHAYLASRCLDMLFGSNPSGNKECSRYAMVYWTYHLEAAVHSGEPFDFDSPIQRAVDQGGRTDSESAFKPQTQPLAFNLTEGDWATMKRNVQKADAATRGQTLEIDEVGNDACILPDQSDEIPGDYYDRHADKSQWLMTRTDGYGQSCPPAVRASSSRACSIKDIVQGFCLLLSADNKDSFGLYLKVLLCKGVCFDVEFSRTATLLGEERERKFIPGGSEVVISEDLGARDDIKTSKPATGTIYLFGRSLKSCCSC